MASDASTDTASRSGTRPHPGDASVAQPYLFLAVEGERPLAAATGYSLSAVDEVILGRGEERGFQLLHEGGRMRLMLRVADRRMSSVHARLSRVLDRWVLEDADSKNGLVLNGARQKRAVLSPGDLFELGHTFFLFAHQPGLPGAAARELSTSFPRPLAPGLSTFNLELSRDFDALAEVARSQVPVVIQGETGTGKEVLARAVHALSRRSGPFVAINCGALPETLVEGELFGHRRGAFTGASEDRPGLVRSASGGTLFLDEIGDLPLPLQAAFLRVLQESEVLPLGAAQPVKVDLRVVAATHRDMVALVEQKQFRSDLYARLAGFFVQLPPLRSRREDLGLLISALLPRVAPGQADRVSFSSEAIRALFNHPWPLNVRELEKALAVAVVLARGGRIELEHLPEPVRAASGQRPPALAAAPTSLPVEEEARRTRLVALLREHRGNISAVAREMGLARMQIQRWLKRYQIDPESFRT